MFMNTLNPYKRLASYLVSVCVLTAAAALVSSRAVAGDAAAQPGPAELIDATARQMMKELDVHRAELRKDPQKIRKLVDTHLLPHFDTEYAAKLVLAKSWRTATPDQRKRFIDAFYQSLLQNYGEALLDATPDRMTIQPYRGDPAETTATVRTEVRRDNGSRVPVNYSMRKTEAGWKAYDVTIEGISYVKSFRTDFGSEIEQKGLDAVIQRLETQQASGKGTSAGSAKDKS
jgi:phospholipid transport system substrate-binding protein